MAETNPYHGITKVVRLTTGSIASHCIECRHALPDGFDDQINHYLEHGYRILHVGPETSLAHDAKTFCTDTVAVLGNAS